MMKKYLMPTLFPVMLFVMIMAFAQLANAEGPVVDPTITPTMTLTCNYPIDREDGTVLAINEIAQVNFFVSPGLISPDWIPAGSNNSECKQVYDLSQVQDGQYYYTANIDDTDGRGSIFSVDAVPTEYWAVVVKRLANPKHPTGFTATFN